MFTSAFGIGVSVIGSFTVMFMLMLPVVWLFTLVSISDVLPVTVIPVSV